MAQRYNWGDGRGRVHSIPLKQHKTDVKALHALGGTTDITAPPTGVQAYREAQAAATAQFGPQVQAAKQLQTNIPAWFQDYLARVAGYAKTASAQAAPVLQQAQSYQQGAAAQTPPGLDPNSEAGQQAAQAAQGRQSLAQLGLDALNGQNLAAQGYLTGRQQIAAREQPQAMTAAANQLATAKSQRGAAVTDFLTNARTQAQNYAIARGTLGLNTQKAQADAASAAATIGERTRHDKASEKNTAASTQAAQQGKYGPGGVGMNKYGFTYDEWTKLDPHTQNKYRTGKIKPRTTGPQNPSSTFADHFYRQFGVKPASTSQIASAQDTLALAQSTIRQVRQSNPNISRQQLGAVLFSGQGKTKDSAAVPKIRSLWATVALDLAYLGYVSKGTQDKLHRAGFLARQFKLPTKPPKLPPVTAPKPLTSNPFSGAANPVGAP